MRTRHKAIASVAIVGILALAPAAAFAQQEQAQAATQVTVDLSGLDHGDRQEPLAQTGDEKQLLAASVAVAGAGQPDSACASNAASSQTQAGHT